MEAAYGEASQKNDENATLSMNAQHRIEIWVAGWAPSESIRIVALLSFYCWKATLYATMRGY